MSDAIKPIPVAGPEIDVWEVWLIFGNQRAWLATIKGYRLARLLANEEARRRKTTLVGVPVALIVAWATGTL